MRKIQLNANRYLVYYGAIASNPDGFKGITAVKNALAVLKKLEALGVQEEKVVSKPGAPKEEKVTTWILRTPDAKPDLELTEDEFGSLRSAMDAAQWTGGGLVIVEDAFQGLELAL